MTVYEIKLPYLKPPLSLNDRMHWARKAGWVRQIRGDVEVLARAGRLPKFVEHADVTLFWYPADLRRRDSDNPTPTLKAAIDGLVKYGLVSDDSSEYVSSRCVIGEVRKPGEVWLEVEVR